jgi:hypothetical protein
VSFRTSHSQLRNKHPSRTPRVKIEVALNRERLLLDLGLLFDLGRTLRLALNSLQTRLTRAFRFARRAVALPLALRAGGAYRAAVFPRAVGAGFAHRALALQPAVRAGVAYRAAVLPLAVRAGVAVPAFSFQTTVRALAAHHAATLLLAERASLSSHHSWSAASLLDPTHEYKPRHARVTMCGRTTEEKRSWLALRRKFSIVPRNFFGEKQRLTAAKLFAHLSAPHHHCSPVTTNPP